MRLSEHSLKHAEAIIKHCTDNGMAVESSMGLWNHLVKVFIRLDVFEGRAPRPAESAPTDAQQAKVAIKIRWFGCAWWQWWTPRWHEGRGPYVSIGFYFIAFYRGY